MRREEGRFPGSGGPEIYWQAWHPPTARAAVVIAHGAAEHGGRYAPLAARLNTAGFAVYALDHRGHGHSTGARTVIDDLDRALADIDHLVDRATSEGGAKPFLLGHSMGGCLALAYALEDQARIEGLILSGPLIALKGLRPILALSRVLAAVAPRLGVHAVDAAAISRDPEQVRSYEEDPLVDRGKLPVRTVAVFAGAIAGFKRRSGDLTLPLLILQGGADRIVPPAGSRRLAVRAGSEDKTLELYPGLYHEIFNEAEPERTAVLDDLVGWLDAHAAPAAFSR
jgi:alpha-beta hydrolase superfamily lysophospholipase